MVSILILLVAAAASAQPLPCDLIFAGGRIVDGTGSPAFRGDVCIRGDRIAEIGRLGDRPARRRIDASRLVVCPGFIDMLGQSEFNVLVDGRAASKITQGITTEITGEGEWGWALLNDRIVAERRQQWERFGVKPDWTTLAGYFRAFERARPAINLGTFVGVRKLVVGDENRPATEEEMRRMEAALAKAMEEGALGFSTSLQYVPDRFASTEELIALAKVARRFGGTYITHQRSEADQIDASLNEVFAIARGADIPAQIFHLKTAYRRNWGQMPAVLRRLEAARAEGLDVSANMYPYIAGANDLDSNLPVWVREGGRERMVERLKDPEVRARAKADILKPDASWENQYLGAGGAAGVLVSDAIVPELKKYEGRTLEEIGREEKRDPLDVLFDLVVASRGQAGCIVFFMSEDDVRAALRHPLVCPLGTDAGAQAVDGPFAGIKTHPRAFGSAARVLGKYVRDQKLLSIEEAVRKMTSLPAARMGLFDRGLLRPGMAADVVAFDPENVADTATFADPLRYSAGIPFVAVNGELVVDSGRITAARPGRPIRGPGYRAGSN